MPNASVPSTEFQGEWVLDTYPPRMTPKHGTPLGRCLKALVLPEPSGTKHWIPDLRGSNLSGHGFRLETALHNDLPACTMVQVALAVSKDEFPVA